jgi:pyruvate kinase
MEQRDPGDLLRLVSEFDALREDVVRKGDSRFQSWEARLSRPGTEASLRNMAHYLALRSHDLTELQDELAPLGLSTLGRSESRVLPTLDAVLASLRAIAGETSATFPLPGDFWHGQRRIDAESERLFGPRPAHRRVRIMVTLSTDAASDYEFVLRLFKAGMNVARINCGHDDPQTWTAMVDNVRRAEAETGRACPVVMDLSGPRARILSVLGEGERVVQGELVLLTPGEPTVHPRYMVQLQCGIPEVVEQLEEGAAVWIDGGKIGAVVCGREGTARVLRIESIRPHGRRIVADKGLNFPGSDLQLSPLTPRDAEALDIAAGHADMVGYSFVQNPSDIDELERELASRGRAIDSIGLILKIETLVAIQHLPQLIVAATGRCPTSVMIARGDLAVEVGFERMAEMQEELLWLCEAAHVPVVWATDVLANLARKGFWSRAEVTDAAMSERADCVMLNKGPFIDQAVRALDNVIQRMEGHQTRKHARMRRLQVWQPAGEGKAESLTTCFQPDRAGSITSVNLPRLGLQPTAAGFGKFVSNLRGATRHATTFCPARDYRECGHPFWHHGNYPVP